MIKDVKLLTGVDQLLNLVQTKGRVSIDEAAKELGLGKTIVREWAEFLEDEGIVNLEFKFSKVFITPKLHKKLTESKVKELNLKKQAFLAKIETAVQSIEEEARELTKSLQEIGNVKDLFDSELKGVKKEIQEMEQYHKLKRELSQGIAKEKVYLDKLLKDIKTQEVNEETTEKGVLEKEKHVEKALKLEQEQIKSKEEAIKNLRAKIRSIKETLEGYDKQAWEELEKITKTEKDTKELEQDLKKSVSHLEELQTTKIKKLEEERKKFEQRINELQHKLLGKIEVQKEKLSEEVGFDKSNLQRLEALLKRKARIEAFLEELSLELEKLKQDFMVLAKKAIVVEALKQSSGFKDIENAFKELEEKKEELERKASKIMINT